MNPDQTPPLEVTPPAGHEILPQDFLREHGAVEGMLSRHKADRIFSASWVPWDSKLELDFENFDFVAPLGTMSARLTPAPKFHNPDNLASAGEPPWRFLVEGENAETGDEGWDKWIKGQWSPTAFDYPMLPGKDHTYRTRRPLSQKGGDEPCATTNAPAPTSLAVPNTAPSTAGPVASNAAPTFDPDARPWLPIADAPRDGAWIEIQLEIDERPIETVRWLNNAWRSKDGQAWFSAERFRLPAPSVPTSGTPRTDKAAFNARGFLDNREPVLVVDADFARTLERELASVTRELTFHHHRCETQHNDGLCGMPQGDCQCAICAPFFKQLLAAQTRADVAEREAESLRELGNIRFREAQEIGREMERRGEAIAHAMFPHRGMTELIPAVKELAGNYTAALRELAELKAKMGERL